jgi:uncharacterized coiled-coil DUF342 family protein
VLDRLALPPEMVLRAFEDLHVIAQNLPALRQAAEEIPRSESELADETRAVRAQVNEIHEEVRDLRDKIPGL